MEPSSHASEKSGIIVHHDPLGPITVRPVPMIFDPEAYGLAAPLLASAKCNELGPGTPERSQHGALQALDVDTLFAPGGPRDREMAHACLAGLWLRYDFLDESHRISQDIGSPTGSYWHAILHRREPDPSNAKYWFRQVGQHPIFAPLQEYAIGVVDPANVASELAKRSGWDPFEFVDLCQAGLDGSPELRQVCMNIQQREWELLFDFCYRKAKG